MMVSYIKIALWILSALVVDWAHCYAIFDPQDQPTLDSPTKLSATTNRKSSSAQASSSSSNVENGTQTSEDLASNQAELEQYWLNERDLFFNLSSFNLTRVSGFPASG